MFQVIKSRQKVVILQEVVKKVLLLDSAKYGSKISAIRHTMLHALVVCNCRPSDRLPSMAGLSQSLDQPRGIIFRHRLKLRLCRPFVSGWKTSCSQSPSSTLFWTTRSILLPLVFVITWTTLIYLWLTDWSIENTRRCTSTPQRRRWCPRYLDGLLWPWPLTYDLRHVIGSSAGAIEHSLSASSKLFKAFIIYRGNDICPEERTNERTRRTDSPKTWCFRWHCWVAKA